jgi:predicted Zn-dependent protease with MMP-like domain
MNRREFENLVRRVLEELPKKFKERLDNVDVVIEEEVDTGQVALRGLGGKGRLLGLYQGVPLKDRTHYYGMVMPDKITLFKGNIERSCKAKGCRIFDEVKHVIEHEIAHHFGISDKRLEDLDVY